MCDELDDRYWHPIGTTPWSGEFCIIEQCGDCLEYRARVIDPNEIPIVKGLPEIPADETTVPDESPDTDSTDDAMSSTSDSETGDDDWLVR